MSIRKVLPWLSGLENTGWRKWNQQLTEVGGKSESLNQSPRLSLRISLSLWCPFQLKFWWQNSRQKDLIIINTKKMEGKKALWNKHDSWTEWINSFIFIYLHLFFTFFPLLLQADVNHFTVNNSNHVNSNNHHIIHYHDYLRNEICYQREISWSSE